MCKQNGETGIEIIDKKHGCVKDHLTIFQKYVDGISGTVDVGMALEKNQLVEIESRLSKIGNLLIN